MTLTLIHQLRYVGNLCIKDIDWLEGKKRNILWYCADWEDKLMPGPIMKMAMTFILLIIQVRLNEVLYFASYNLLATILVVLSSRFCFKNVIKINNWMITIYFIWQDHKMGRMFCKRLFARVIFRKI